MISSGDLMETSVSAIAVLPPKGNACIRRSPPPAMDGGPFEDMAVVLGCQCVEGVVHAQQGWVMILIEI